MSKKPGDRSGGADIVNAATGEHRLANGALNMWQVLFCIVTGAAPIAAMLFNGRGRCSAAAGRHRPPSWSRRSS